MIQHFNLILFVFGIIDFLLAYLISHCLVRKEISWKVSHFVLGILYTVISQLIRIFMMHYIDSNMLGFALFVIAFIKGLIVIRILHNQRLSSTLLLTTVTYTVIMVAIFPLLFMETLNTNLCFIQLAIQVIALIIILIICKKVKLYKLYDMIQHKLLPNILVKQLFLLFSFTMFIYAFVAAIHGHNLLYFFLFLSVLVLFAVILIPVTIKLYQRSMKEMISTHDLYNSLLSTGIAIESMGDLEAVKLKFKEHCKRFDIDFTSNTKQEVNQQIERFIHLKKEHRKANIEIIFHIDYYKDHHQVELQQILQWLGTLLDHAFDMSINQPVYVRMAVTNSHITLSVASEYSGERIENFEAISENEYSTKENELGSSFHQLQQTVSDFGGQVSCFEEYKEIYHNHYLTILIEFK